MRGFQIVHIHITRCACMYMMACSAMPAAPLPNKDSLHGQGGHERWRGESPKGCMKIGYTSQGCMGPPAHGVAGLVMDRLPSIAYGARPLSVEVARPQRPPLVGTSSLTSSFMSVRKNSFLPRPLNV